MSTRRKIFINTNADDPASALVRSFTEPGAANPFQIARSDSFLLELHFLSLNPIPTPGRPFLYVDPSTWVATKFAMGPIGATPDGGTFTLTSSISGTTGSIAYNASTATVQTAIQGLGGLGSATVTGSTGGPYNVDSNSTSNGTLAITGNAAALAPDGSTVVITKTQTANGSLTNRWIISLAKALPVLNTSWSALASASVTVTTVQVGSSTANKAFRVVWNDNAYFGGVLLSFYDGSTTTTVGPIAYNAQAPDVAAAWTPLGAGKEVSVVQNNLGDFTITCTGTSINGAGAGNNPSLSTSSNTLVVPVGFVGVVTASTAGVNTVLNGAASATTYLEIEATRIANEPETMAQISNAVFLADLISNTPGQATGNDNYLNIHTGVGFLKSVTGYTGGGTTNLDGVATVGVYNTLDVVEFIHATYGIRQFQFVNPDSTATDTGNVIQPTDNSGARWIGVL
jgi:hypothetical protein